ncbi:MAG: HAMP domain-containing histidine kinase [Verrucomicrobiaceae bacterium]|nr:HAMP domain-containing histidine kinase [Verrucomicrobiaceae bacterium]
MRGKVYLTCLAAGLMLAVSPRLLAQQAVVPSLITIPELLTNAETGADTAGQQVKIRGVVLGLSTLFNLFFVYESGSGVWVRYGREMAAPKQGEVVEVAGRTSNANAGGRRSITIIADEIKSEDVAALPEPRPVTIPELEEPSAFDLWARFDAVVMEWKYRTPNLMLKVVTRDGVADAVIAFHERGAIPEKLIGARVRLTGLMTITSVMGRTFFVPGPPQLQIIEPGTAGIFDAPAASVPDVMQRKVEPGKRWRVTGVLAAILQKREAIIVSKEGAMQVSLLPSREVGESGTDYGDAGIWSEPVPGDEVEIVGSIYGLTLRERQPFGLQACAIRVVKKGTAPTPEPMSLEKLGKLRDEDRWVEVRGVVTAWMQQGGLLSLAVVDEFGYGIVQVRQWSGGFPADLHGARVKMTGVSRSLLQRAQDLLLVPNKDFFQVIKPGRTESFAAPAVITTQIVERSIPPADRVRTRGVVLGNDDKGVLYLRGDGAALKIQLQTPWSRSSSTRTGFQVDGGTPAAVGVGEEVEIVGSQVDVTSGVLEPACDLSECHLRVTGRVVEVKPMLSTVKEVAEGAFTSDYVEVRGRLLGMQQVSAMGEDWRTNLLLDGGRVSIYANHVGRDRSGFANVKVDDDVLVRGIVNGSSGRKSRHLRILSPEEVHSLGLSPSVRRRQFWMWGGGGVVVLGILLSWIASLRRSSRLQSESAQMLEQRVSERTAELRRTQADLHKALDQERELNELKTRFVSMVSHEFRTPLGVIMSSVELLKHYSDRLPEDEKKRQLEDIHAATRHMGGMMEQVLVLGRAEAGKLTCKPQQMDLAPALAKIVDDVQALTGDKCPIHTTIADDIVKVYADEALLRHILNNLLSNAVKYSNDGVPVTMNVRREGDEGVIEVMDQGIGILEKDRLRLFEAFYRGSNVGEIPGTGLGLVIVKRCLEMHGGRVVLESRDEGGTIFRVFLPFFRVPEPEA